MHTIPQNETIQTIQHGESVNPQKKKRDKSKFHFKKFILSHEHCAMKVGTDGLLLAGYCASLAPGLPLPHTTGIWPQRILDIGCGSGLITVLLAQHYQSALLDSVDIDDAAIAQTKLNLQQPACSGWASRVTVHHASVQRYVADAHTLYDLVVCAPPYFVQALNALAEHQVGKRRKVARHLVPQESMTLQELLSCASRLLRPRTGRFCFIFPVDKVEETEKSIELSNLEIVQVMKIRDYSQSPVIRHIYQCKLKDIGEQIQQQNEQLLVQQGKELLVQQDEQLLVQQGKEQLQYDKEQLQHDKEQTQHKSTEHIQFSIYAHAQPKELQFVKRKYSPEYIALLEEFCDHMFRT